ncbi:MAG: succinyl-diaminopimelate desuccinylase, partial [Candidatus Sumerlaeota bacterium]|nr:succinyl-diaminopimelate desuccinylase [Candidatus Sumerlaeota bacterium]
MTTPQDIARRLSDIIEAHRDELVADTSRILQFRTVSGGNAQEQADYEREIPACFEWLGGLARRLGFQFRVLDGVVGEIALPHPDPDAPICAVACHIDVVTAKGEWTHPPFSGAVEDGQIWGRGAQDDKGPLIQTLHALRAIREAAIALPCHVHVIVGTKEETGDWSDIDHYLANAPRPDFGFTPDADFPIINGEKGMLSVGFKADWTPAGIDEETGLEFVSLIGGERENIVPSLCELTLRFPSQARNEVMKELVRSTTEFVVQNRDANVTMQPARERDLDDGRHESAVSFIGRAAHAARPDMGHNAIVDALAFIMDLETFPAPLRAFSAFLHLAGMTTNGASLGLDKEHPFIGETSACLALLELRPEGGRAVLNVRPTMGLTCAEVLDKCRAAAAIWKEQTGLAIEVYEKTRGMDAIYLDPASPVASPFLESLQQGFELVTEQKGELRSIGGTTYAKALPNCCAFGPTLDEPDLIHQANERVPIDAVVRNAKVFATSLALLSLNRVGGRVAPSSLSHHRTSSAASGGFVSSEHQVP